MIIRHSYSGARLDLYPEATDYNVNMLFKQIGMELWHALKDKVVRTVDATGHPVYTIVLRVEAEDVREAT